MKLSVLDQSVAVSGRGEDAALRNTLELAKYCEALGYHRFWVSEHHSHPTIVGSAPEVLMGAIAASTRRIRIGSAGVMLPHYSAYKVAEQFRVLDALAPGRIDLGVGRAPGSDFRTAQILNPNARSASDFFPEQVADLRSWIHGEDLPAAHPGRGVFARPLAATAPELWMLGSSDYGAQLAAHYGLPYAFAWFITDGQGADGALELYRARYTPSAAWPKPYSAVCVWALAAETSEEAWRLFSSRERWRVERNRGLLGPLRPPEELAGQAYAPQDELQAEQIRKRAFVGSAGEVALRLRALQADLQADELVIITWTHDEVARRRSYALLAEEFQLGEE
ncbi:MAG: LLM class flavin-dependent oxidoreductase [Candidatus Protistobacter heckmanni]|nr:LLM class flavin-dependent oxidoreductase [Candidatus Protistobacter heckmanni]